MSYPFYTPACRENLQLPLSVARFLLQWLWDAGAIVVFMEGEVNMRITSSVGISYTTIFVFREDFLSFHLVLYDQHISCVVNTIDGCSLHNDVVTMTARRAG